MKKRMYFVLAVALVLSVFCLYREKIFYAHYVSNFNEITISDFYHLLEEFEEKDSFVYFGRGTCPYCRNFVKELRVASAETNTDIYYINTENTDTSAKLKNLREKLHIDLVPALVRIDSAAGTAKKISLENYNQEYLRTIFNNK